MGRFGDGSSSTKKRYGVRFMRTRTLLATAGCSPKDCDGAVNPPVYRASTVVMATLDEFDRALRGEIKCYGRYGTPTTSALEESLALLEGADCAKVFPSGLNAIWTALGAFVSSGDHILMIDCAYSPARRICTNELSRFGIETTFFHPAAGVGIEQLIKPNTRLVYLESPGFLTMEVVDLPAIAAVAQRYNLVVVCDSTWATPLYCKPFELGIDVSLHSATKYISGHSDALLGVLSYKDQHRETIERYADNNGAAVSGDVCYLVQRGLRTLDVRLKQHYESALKVASWLSTHPLVERVLYPALPQSPGYDAWKTLYSGASGLFSFVLKESYSREMLAQMLNRMEICSMGFSWGGFESLLIPFDPRPVRVASEWPYRGQAFRLHVGLEDVDDIIEDLQKGFERLCSGAE